MNQNAVMKSDWVPEQAELSSYLNDVSEMETAIFAIDQAIEESKAEREKKKRELLWNAEKVRRECARHQEEVRRNAERNYSEKTPVAPSWPSPVPEPEEPRNVLGKLLGIPIALVCAFSGVGFTFSMGEPMGMLLLPIGIMILIIGFTRDSRRNTKEQEERSLEYQRRCSVRKAAYQNACRDHEEKCAQYEARKNAYITKQVVTAEKSCYEQIRNAETKIQAFDATEGAFLQKVEAVLLQREQIQMSLSKLYAYNLVPPDYRTMDCALMLTHIFRNGLADNMRDAINLYETRVYRGEMVRGIQNIYNNLDKLSLQLGQVGRTLESVRHHVSLMSSDLCDIASRSEEGARLQEEILRESKLGRYAAEAVKEGTKRLEHYAEKWDKLTD